MFNFPAEKVESTGKTIYRWSRARRGAVPARLLSTIILGRPTRDGLAGSDLAAVT